MGTRKMSEVQQLEHVDVEDELQADRIKNAEGMVKDMTIINDISTDLNQQTHAQQEGLDNISDDIQKSKESIDTGNNHLVAAVEANKAHKQWLCCIAMLSIVAIGVVALIIYFMTK